MTESAITEILAERLYRSSDPARMARALWARHVERRAHSDIGRELGISRERVRQLDRHGLRVLRGVRRVDRARLEAACPPVLLAAVLGEG